MRILGIDPGIARTGWGVIESNNSKIKIQSFGCIETSVKSNIQQRLFQLHRQLLKIIKGNKPDIISIEDLFFNTNTKTALAVGQARGVVFLTGEESNLSFAIYTPLQVKMAVTGYGRAEKSQIGKMVKNILKLDTVPMPDDAADALAVALTHAFSMKMKERI